MYIIIANGREIGVAESPTYIRKQSNGTYALCDESIAQGVAFEGKPYQIIDRDDMGGGLVRVRLQEVDTGSRLMAQQAANARNAANIDYLSMMTDVELPNEEVQTDEPEI